MAEEQGQTASTTPTAEFDAVVVGAGFGGIYMLHKLRNELGLNVRAFDRAGVWAAPGTGTVTRVRCRTPRASCTATPSTTNC